MLIPPHWHSKPDVHHLSCLVKIIPWGHCANCLGDHLESAISNLDTSLRYEMESLDRSLTSAIEDMSKGSAIRPFMEGKDRMSEMTEKLDRKSAFFEDKSSIATKVALCIAITDNLIRLDRKCCEWTSRLVRDDGKTVLASKYHAFVLCNKHPLISQGRPRSSLME